MSRNRLWRTQVVIREVLPDHTPPSFFVDIPAMGTEEVELEISSLPENLRGKLREGARWHARVNIGTDDMSALLFEEWEPW